MVLGNHRDLCLLNYDDYLWMYWNILIHKKTGLWKLSDLFLYNHLPQFHELFPLSHLCLQIISIMDHTNNWYLYGPLLKLFKSSNFLYNFSMSMIFMPLNNINNEPYKELVWEFETYCFVLNWISPCKRFVLYISFTTIVQHEQHFLF